jgi:phosphoglycerate dehydrogenase-like enzyme
MNIVVLHEFPEPALKLLRQAVPGADIHYYPGTQWDDIPVAVTSIAEVLYTSKALPAPETAPNLKWVQANWAGVDQIIDHPLFKARRTTTAAGHDGIQLTTASGVHAINISEYIVMMMLALSHRMPSAFRMMRKAKWTTDRSLFVPQELHGASVGLIGFGAIGRQTARLCSALGMRVLAMRRSSATQESGVEFFSHQQIKVFLGECDYVILTVPLTPDSHHLLDATALAAMKNSAFLINISRGAIVDEDALIAALLERRLAGAALDVFAQEPLPEDSPFWQMENVILTPHIAGITPNYDYRAAELFADNLRRYTAGRPLINLVDFVRGY